MLILFLTEIVNPPPFFSNLQVIILISELLDRVLFGVPVVKIGLFFIIILFTFIIKSILLYILDKRLTILVKKTKTELDDMLLKAIKSPLGYMILLQGFYVAIHPGINKGGL